MQPFKSFKREFLKKLLQGLHQSGLPSKKMSLLERERAVKISSDAALACASGGSKWSRALITSLCKHEPEKTLVRNILGKEYDGFTKPWLSSLSAKKLQSRSILKRSCMRRRMRRTAGKRGLAASVAMRLQKRRTRLLKALVPGGELMDELSLLEETVDYVLSLKAQVDVMQHLANFFDQPCLK